MQHLFESLHELIKKPLEPERGVKTDSSILLIYPPDKELDFREYLLDTFVPRLQADKLPFDIVDLTGFLFRGLSPEDLQELREEEFEDYRWMQQGLSKRTESALQDELTERVQSHPGCTVLVYSTVALHPLVRFGEVLRGLRDLPGRIVLAFPGEERGGKLCFMNQPDGGNYLAVKLFAQ